MWCRSGLSRLYLPLGGLIGVLAVGLAGLALLGATQSGQSDDRLPDGLDCPDGLEDVVSADYSWARADAPTARAALEEFVTGQFPSLSADDFVREEPDLGDTGHLPPRDLARFVHYRDGAKLADLDLNSWRTVGQGWVVHSYMACKSLEEGA